MELIPAKPPRQQAVLNRIDYERRYFRYHRRRIPLDSLGKLLCEKIERNFANDNINLPQVLWVYHTANAIFIKTIEISKFKWQSKERLNAIRNLQILKGFLYKDMLQWEKTS